MIAFQAIIIKRFMGEQAFAEFLEEYKAARKQLRIDRTASPLDRKIYEDYAKKGMPISEISEKYHVSRKAITSSILTLAGKD